MTKHSQHTLLVLLSMAVLPISASSQSIPADVGAGPGVGFQLPRIGGSLSYALSASEAISNGFYDNSGVEATTIFSGDVAYVSKSVRHPFSAIYSGGVLLANSGQPTTTFQNLSFSQVLSTKRWNIAVADSVSYLPESPVTGLSGIPGVGDLGVDPVTVGPTSGIGILTTYGPRVSNTLSGTVSRSITAHLSAQVSGDYGVQRFIGDNSDLALDSTTYGGSAGVTYHFNARNSLTGNYNYSRFSYSGEPYSFTTQGATVDYSRQWSRRLTTDVYVGPQVISSDEPGFAGSSVEIAAGASASYLTRRVNYALSYSRGVNNGSGVIPGSFSDNITLSAHRIFGQHWNVSGALGYSRSRSLPNFEYFTYSGDSVAASGQVSRGLGRRFSVFGSYTVADQSTSNTSNPLNAFNGVYQVVGFGITYSPGSIPLGR